MGNPVKRIREAAREIPVPAATDVLVVGSGAASLAAALSIKENAASSQVDIASLQRAQIKKGGRTN